VQAEKLAIGSNDLDQANALWVASRGLVVVTSYFFSKRVFEKEATV
jgi:hypothetical protein